MIVPVEQSKIFGQLFWALEIGHVDVGTLRGVSRVVGSSVDHRNGAVDQRAVELFRDVERAEIVLGGKIKLVVADDFVSALVRVVRLARQVPALAVNVDGQILGQLFDVVLSLARCRAVADEPGHEIGLIFHGKNGFGTAEARFVASLQRSIVERVVNVGIPSVSHRPVDVVGRNDGKAVVSPLVVHRQCLPIDVDEPLVGESHWRQVADVEVRRSAVKNDGIAMIEPRPIQSRPAVGYPAMFKCRSAISESQICKNNV